jgi:hypothetical protein
MHIYCNYFEFVIIYIDVSLLCEMHSHRPRGGGESNEKI